MVCLVYCVVCEFVMWFLIAVCCDATQYKKQMIVLNSEGLKETVGIKENRQKKAFLSVMNGVQYALLLYNWYFRQT